MYNELPWQGEGNGEISGGGREKEKVYKIIKSSLPLDTLVWGAGVEGV